MKLWREFGHKCNTCSDTACLTCKNLYYLDSKTGTPRCIPCPYPKVCQSATAFTSCTYGSHIQITTSVPFQCSTQDFTYATQIDSTGVIQSCIAGYLPSASGIMCVPISGSTVSTVCDEGCALCDSVTNVCSQCIPLKYMLNSQSICIGCSVTGRESHINELFFTDDNTCFSIFTYPVNLDNCITEAGLAGGFCKLCNYGYILNSSKTACVSCVDAIINASSTANQIEIDITYSCTGSPIATKPIKVNIDLNTIAIDPYTQPTFYSIRFGLPLSVANKLNLTALVTASPVLANDQPETSTKQTQEVKSTVINEAQTQKINDSNIIRAGVCLLLLVYFYLF